VGREGVRSQKKHSERRAHGGARSSNTGFLREERFDTPITRTTAEERFSQKSLEPKSLLNLGKEKVRGLGSTAKAPKDEKQPCGFEGRRTGREATK